MTVQRPILQGQRALVVGIANEHSIAHGCARAFRELGAELAITCLKTRAASGLKDFDLMLNEAMQRAPLGDLVDIMDVGFACAYLATPYARRITRTTLYVDGGVNVMA